MIDTSSLYLFFKYTLPKFFLIYNIFVGRYFRILINLMCPWDLEKKSWVKLILISEFTLNNNYLIIKHSLNFQMFVDKCQMFWVSNGWVQARNFLKIYPGQKAFIASLGIVVPEDNILLNFHPSFLDQKKLQAVSIFEAKAITVITDIRWDIRHVRSIHLHTLPTLK